jgi:ABC-type uncharacterized transport system ATPase component
MSTIWQKSEKALFSFLTRVENIYINKIQTKRILVPESLVRRRSFQDRRREADRHQQRFSFLSFHQRPTLKLLR